MGRVGPGWLEKKRVEGGVVRREVVGCREVVAEVEPECGPECELRHPATVESHGTVLSLVID